MVNANARAKAPARRAATWLAVCAAGVALALMPQLLSPYVLLLFCYALIFALACLGLNLLLGTTGPLSPGHAV